MVWQNCSVDDTGSIHVLQLNVINLNLSNKNVFLEGNKILYIYLLKQNLTPKQLQSTKLRPRWFYFCDIYTMGSSQKPKTNYICMTIN